MSSIFEITREHIGALDDADTRELVGRLCLEEARKRGVDPSGVTFGGDQRAKDGGIDVHVELPESAPVGGYLPRHETGFQVKAEKLPPAKIAEEMRPKGTLRQSIIDLGKAGGAYIIVSSRDSLSKSALSARRNAMAIALADAPEAAGLHLDFFDQQRLASWVNQHPGLIPWVREKAKEPLSGWQPFRDWSSSPQSLDAEYVLDEHIRIIGVRLKDTDGLAAVAGIEKIRETLRSPKGVVRLVGLSGVGKTRLVQALFDDRVGANALSQNLAVYADLSDSPDPVPQELFSRLSAAGRRCILIVDNCGVELHRKLAARVAQSDGGISVVTIEYDISDDEPENTDVFKLEPSSPRVIEAVLARRYPALTSSEISTIAEFSEGNARVALALAETAPGDGSLANLKDSDLFKRLFQQRKDNDPALLQAAKACSLVYSFNGEATEGEAAELPTLAALAGQSTDQLYGHVAELLRRKLVQRRGDWRALLPHALAHKLAKEFLEERPAKQTADVFTQQTNTRLARSFSRRLGYLHDSAPAQKIAEYWLADGGWLSELENFNEFGLAAFENIAPIAPESILSAIERGWERSEGFKGRGSQFEATMIRLLRLLAYEPTLFDRALRLISQFAGRREKTNNRSDAANVFESLFHVYLSGSHAPPAQRTAFLLQLAETGGDKEKALALAGLDAMLKTDGFSSSYGFEFGTRKRDYGFEPRTNELVHEWFGAALQLARVFLDRSLVDENELKAMLARSFKSVCRDAGMVDELISLADHIHARKGWPHAWASVKAAARSARKAKHGETAKKLSQLADRLKPTDLPTLITAYVLPERWSLLDIADIEIEDEKRYEKASAEIDAKCEEIGRLLGSDLDALKENLPLLFQGRSDRAWTVAKAVGQYAAQPLEAWRVIVDSYLGATPADQSGRVQSGFLAGLAEVDGGLCEQILDEVLADARLHRLFLYLQSTVGISERGYDRLMQAARLQTVPTESFQNIAYTHPQHQMSVDQLGRLIPLILERDDGYAAALAIVHMRLWRDARSGEITETAKTIGRDLLAKAEFVRGGQRDEFELTEVVNRCLRPGQDLPIATTLCERLLDAINRNNINAWDYGKLVHLLATNFPRAVLDVLVEYDTDEEYGYRRSMFKMFRERQACPIAAIDEGELVAWAAEKPESRFPKLAEAMRPWKPVSIEDPSREDPDVEWAPAALRLVAAAHDPIQVLEIFYDKLAPSSWSGSRADIMARRLPLIAMLKGDPNPAIAAWATKTEPRLEKRIEQEREWEASLDRERDERFE